MTGVVFFSAPAPSLSPTRIASDTGTRVLVAPRLVSDRGLFALASATRARAPLCDQTPFPRARTWPIGRSIPSSRQWKAFSTHCMACFATNPALPKPCGAHGGSVLSGSNGRISVSLLTLFWSFCDSSSMSRTSPPQVITVMISGERLREVRD